MGTQPFLIAADLEGVFLPEIWKAVHKKTGIEKLKLTTRDIADYDELMQLRLKILDENNLTLKDIQEVITTLEPLPGAKEFSDWLKSKAPFIVLSDTFYEFARPLMAKLDFPCLFCHSLEVDDKKRIKNYRLRISDGKRRAVETFRSLNFRVIAMGDSYNDTSMLKAADFGILFRPPENVIKEFPQFPVFTEYEDIKKHIDQILAG